MNEINAVEALARRVERLERQKRQLTRGIIGILVLIGGVAAAAQVTPPRPVPITSDRFTLVDGDNRTRAVLEDGGSKAPLGANPMLTFYDQQGRPRIRLGLGPRGPVLEVTDAAGKTQDYFGPPTVRPATNQ